MNIKEFYPNVQWYREDGKYYIVNHIEHGTNFSETQTCEIPEWLYNLIDLLNGCYCEYANMTSKNENKA